ncbi:conserved hypothetical protein [Desulfosarcina cetonica]|uniref:hypothetical protein n=1 Tax=Desulfosarcina cetonica TaxID=90730 RepID=UPI0006CFE39C|nr:hypothetical protein [Desulfosarcina cetonica]VTR65226.1 conserved hypothetical protein [Desulfosarcina cetonica]
MSESSPLVRVHVNIEISAAALQAVVTHSKQKAAMDKAGAQRMDTADMLGDLISRFLQEKDFVAFAESQENY